MVSAISIITFIQSIVCDAKYIGQVLQDLIIFHCNMSPAGATHNGNLVSLCLPN